ncbi:Alpha/beta hydrolase family protein [Actinacidiphila rubida]|uniref:Alpha/beta hydrolase family protein n=1 Tax=Actinacidiphila rubida TaxID=310780 RepID=A0A1H8F622_9ACTN|nr:alpha/beta fold hydrolase [Actinacidiphila rubida]SEN27311.1 Alpha/beta hydrolase family protein [Actinacidiphila rubida]
MSPAPPSVPAPAPAAAPVFVLVPELHTTAWVWDELAVTLRESGGHAHPVQLSPDPDADLETHIADVLAALEALDAHDGPPAAPAHPVVLVGHGYGIHPALGAADRRPDRVARVVHLDAGLPRDGDPPLALVPDQSLRDRLTGDVLAPPAAGDLQRWGSQDGVPAAAAERLLARAVPQPVRTLTQPLRLTGAVDAVPSTGVLCTANGTSIALVELLAGMGDPRIATLIERRARLFDLASGHWPMLSHPAELAGVLLAAAAGEGRELAVPERRDAASAPPGTFLLDVPECPRERVGRVDLHLPDAQEPRPAVVFVHGGPVPADRRPTPRDTPLFLGHARHAASLGLVGVTLDHRLHDLSSFPTAAADVAAAVDTVRADPRVDADRVALWFLSAGGLLSADWLAAPPPWLRCAAFSYPVLAPLPNWGLPAGRFRPADALGTAGALPLVLTRPGLELPEIAATVDAFLAAARRASIPLEVLELRLAQHGFEVLDHTGETRAAARRAMASVRRHLLAD